MDNELKERWMRIGRQGVVTMLVLGALVMAVAPAGAEDLKWLGVHGAYYSQYEKCALGINARTDVGDSFSVGFLVDYVFQGDSRETWAASADLQWETPLPGHFLDGWVGGGVGVFRDDLRQPNRNADYQPFAAAFVGVGLGNHPIMPYVEMRFVSHEVFHGVLYAGVRF
jgi:hypothetical protein